MTSALGPGPFPSFFSKIHGKLLPITSVLSLLSGLIRNANSTSLPSYLGICIYVSGSFPGWSGLSWAWKGAPLGRAGWDAPARLPGAATAQLSSGLLFLMCPFLEAPAPATDASDQRGLVSVWSRREM